MVLSDTQFEMQKMRVLIFICIYCVSVNDGMSIISPTLEEAYTLNPTSEKVVPYQDAQKSQCEIQNEKVIVFIRELRRETERLISAIQVHVLSEITKARSLDELDARSEQQINDTYSNDEMKPSSDEPRGRSLLQTIEQAEKIIKIMNDIEEDRTQLLKDFDGVVKKSNEILEDLNNEFNTEANTLSEFTEIITDIVSEQVIKSNETHKEEEKDIDVVQTEANSNLTEKVYSTTTRDGIEWITLKTEEGDKRQDSHGNVTTDIKEVAVTGVQETHRIPFTSKPESVSSKRSGPVILPGTAELSEREETRRGTTGDGTNDVRVTESPEKLNTSVSTVPNLEEQTNQYLSPEGVSIQGELLESTTEEETTVPIYLLLASELDITTDSLTTHDHTKVTAGDQSSTERLDSGDTTDGHSTRDIQRPTSVPADSTERRTTSATTKDADTQYPVDPKDKLFTTSENEISTGPSGTTDRDSTSNQTSVTEILSEIEQLLRTSEDLKMTTSAPTDITDRITTYGTTKDSDDGTFTPYPFDPRGRFFSTSGNKVSTGPSGTTDRDSTSNQTSFAEILSEIERLLTTSDDFKMTTSAPTYSSDRITTYGTTKDRDDGTFTPYPFDPWGRLFFTSENRISTGPSSTTDTDSISNQSSFAEILSEIERTLRTSDGLAMTTSAPTDSADRITTYSTTQDSDEGIFTSHPFDPRGRFFSTSENRISTGPSSTTDRDSTSKQTSLAEILSETERLLRTSDDLKMTTSAPTDITDRITKYGTTKVSDDGTSTPYPFDPRGRFFSTSANRISTGSSSTSDRDPILNQTSFADTLTEINKLLRTRDNLVTPTSRRFNLEVEDETTSSDSKVIPTAGYPNIIIDIQRFMETTVESSLTTSKQVAQTTESIVTTEAASTVPPPPQDCYDLWNRGERRNGMYEIFPHMHRGFLVYCDLNDVNGGWTIIQRRVNGSVNFYRSYFDYFVGFGDLEMEFWLGNEKLHHLTKQKKYELTVMLWSFDDESRYARYKTFRVGNFSSGYELKVGGYSGNAGNSLGYHSRGRFSTFDVDNDDNPTMSCARKYTSGWWFRDCLKSNLNGQYLRGKHQDKHNGIVWQHWQGEESSLRYVEMRIKPRTS